MKVHKVELISQDKLVFNCELPLYVPDCCAFADPELAKRITAEGQRQLADVLNYTICADCMGTGCNGHPDSGNVCHKCNGSGGVPQ